MAATHPETPTRPTAQSRAPQAAARRVPHPSRELSWIEFNAGPPPGHRRANPPLERIKFLAIFASNLDEFFQVRISTLRRAARSSRVTPLGRGPSAGGTAGPGTTPDHRAVRDQSATYKKLRRLLANHRRRDRRLRQGAGASCRAPERFLAEIYPVLTPLAVDPGHPFPYITSLTLSVAVALRDPVTDERRFARVKVPAVLPRLVELPRDDGHPASEHRFTLLDQVIGANLDIPSRAWRSSATTCSG